ncbi:MAG: PatB family C-S lyase [Verrucomicrobiae bacterium]|nr:PatB family C-S lyase [Verrucomicrobiae bacterium]
MLYDFDTPVQRRDTASLKWDKYKDGPILPFWVADMDFKSAPEIQEAIARRNQHGVYGYTAPSEEDKQSVVDYMARVHGYEIDPSWILWTPGVVPALNLFCRAFGEAGSSVMTATPVYPPFLTAPANSNRELIAVELMWDGKRWTFDFEAMEKAIRPDTRSFILCNPHNPVGRVFSKEELIQLADFCIRHDLILCTDEIHSDLVLEPGIKHTPTNLVHPEISQRSIMLSSPSKSYNLPGLCCAYAIIESPSVRAAFRKVARGIITEINVFGYVGCQAAYNHGGPWHKDLIQYLRANRDFLYQFVSEKLPCIGMRPMEATYLAWMDIRQLELEDPVAFFESHGVGLSDGSFFGGPGHVRFNFGCARSLLKEGLERMQKAVDSL